MKRAMAIAAHPDDIEFVMSGTMMHLAEAGYELHYMNLADGCCGTTQYDQETIAAMRLTEARTAAQRIGATFHPPIRHDLEIFYDKETLAELTSIYRRVAPEILLVHAPDDYMEDHMNACRLALSAAFCRGMPNFPVDPPRDPVSQSVTVYHAQPYGNVTPMGEPVRPSLFVDVSSVIEQKAEMLADHVSQKVWLDESQGHDSYLETMRQLCRDVGQMSGQYEYAEGWRKHLHTGYCGRDDDLLASVLSDKCCRDGEEV